MAVNKKVLIVDDDKEARQIIRKVLNKLDFIDFLEANNGEEAIQIAQNEHPNLILMDVVMPGMDGYETCDQIKKDPNMESTIIIFMTAKTMDEIDDKIIQVRGSDLLRKPLDASELFFRVKNYLLLMGAETKRMTESAMVSIACIGNVSDVCIRKDSIDLGRNFHYHTNSKMLCKANHYIPLMPQEIMLLELLIRARNRVVSYSELLNVISVEGESSIDNLRTLIKLLRRKTYKELIKNLYSYGYQLMI